LDIIKKNTEWCKEKYPLGDFKWNKPIHKIDESDNSWDVVFSRHVVDHMESFEKAVDEHKRVAKQLVLIVMWVPMSNADEHQIKNIVGGPQDNRKTYVNEYTNLYSRKLVNEYLNGDPEWELLELTEGVGSEVSGHDWVFVLKKK
jgi:ubiquinone/menaquinone biosynthesis C-methylase UbiE